MDANGNPGIAGTDPGGALATWLAQRNPRARELRVDGISRPSSSGYSNETVFFRARWREGTAWHQRRYVARIEPRTPPVYPLQTAQALPSVALQYRVMQAVAHAGGVPVAPLVGHEESDALLGGPFYVMDFVDGDVPKDNPVYTKEGFFVAANAGQRHRLIDSGLAALARLHAIEPGPAGLDWLAGGVRPGLGRQLEIYRRYASELLGGRAHPVLAHAFEWLGRESGADGTIVPSWGDARIGNMIFRDFGCVAVNDWEAAALGPAELDLGWWLMFDRFAHETSGQPRLEGEPTREEQIALYEKHAGRSVGDPFYHEVFAAARFTTVMIRTCQRSTDAGLVPASMNMPVNNPATQVLADLLDVRYAWLQAAGVAS
ncbi:MAG: phosphotransferase family protein [Pseudomonadales bacterium]|jgi:aminoglycoside phosphotransferase (APT) family kinase protein|nr:phosphotransferase family protein [Pseudomonadales bacterium]MBP9035666.1 phosphotransferase family protein [Pseudomonadales bacterium]